MKHRLLFVLSLFVGFASFGQIARDSDQIQDGDVRYHGQNRTSATETVIMSEDFANGIPSTWIHQGTANGTADPDARFEYRGIVTTPSNATGSRGFYAGAALPIASPTTSNGFIILDSDYLDNSGLTGNNGNGPAAAPHLVTLAPPMMDLTQYSNIVVSFTNYYRRRQGTQNLSTAVSATYLDFSTDGGQTWPHSVELNTHIGNNQSTAADFLVEVNASSFIGGQDSAMFRLRFDGRYYYWQVDDIEVKVPEYNRMKFTSFNGAPPVDVLYNSTSRYGHMSQFEQRPITVDANVYNFGVNPQTNVYLALDVLDPNGAVVATAYSDTTASLAPGDTLDFTQLNTYNRAVGALTFVPGTYSFAVRVVSDSTIEAFDTLSYQLSEQRMALDFGGFDNSLGTNALGLDGAGMAVYMDLGMFNPATATAQRLFGVELGLSSLTTGGTIEVSVYDTAAWQGYTAGFDQTGLLAYATDSITAADISSQTKYFDFGQQLLQSGAVYVAVNMYSNNGQYEVRLKNDQTIRQTGLSKMMYNANDARWFSGYSNSMTFNAPWIRVDVCPNIPGACGLGTSEPVETLWTLSPNPGAQGFNVPEFGEVSVVDAFGRVVLCARAERGSWVDASKWSPGLYFVTLNGVTLRWIKL